MYNMYGSPTVTNCTFSGNYAGYGGGGMYNESGSNPKVINCTFSGNSAGVFGGGMYNGEYTDPTVTNCTFNGNSSTYYGGGMYNNDYSDPTVTNCILWGDLPNEIINDKHSNPTVTFSDVQGGYPGEGNIDEDPMFVLADKDDPRLLWPSPCIDTGDPTLFDPDGTRSDMGARFFNQDDYMTLYLTPDATEVLPGVELGVTYTAINRWAQPEQFWVLSQVILPGGASLNVLGPSQYTLPANYTAQVHFTHPVPNITPVGMYEYRSLMGMPPGTLYDKDKFTFKVIE
jgi:parallel beta-helix repeat protein